MGYRRIPAITIPTDPAILAYAAGLIDGEGCISISQSFNQGKSKAISHALYVQIGNTDRRMIDWLVSQFGGSVWDNEAEKERRAANGHKVLYRWHLTGNNAGLFLEAILPFLVIKREQAVVGLDLRATKLRSYATGIPDDVLARRVGLKEEMHRLNRKGPMPERVPA